MNATMSLEITKHQPVMLNQVLSIISPQHGGTYIDCTFGGGGYSQAILKYPNTKVLALDRDEFVHPIAENLKKKFPKRFNFFKNKFSNLNKLIDLNLKPRAIIYDLGLSSFQLSDKKRGFSFDSENFLNMEMGINKYSAYKVINDFDKEKLSKIIKILGEEKDARKIANKIINYRTKSKIKTSLELAKIIKETKKNYNNFKKNPATKTFQAIRIFVNQELSELILSLIEATKLLAKGGILIVVSFHSLEDKIVKNFFNLYSNFRRNPSRYFPAKEKNLELFKLSSRKSISPEIKEIKQNFRARSAKLRYGIRTENPFFYPKEFKKKFENYLNLERVIT